MDRISLFAALFFYTFCISAQQPFRLSYTFTAPAVEKVYVDELGNVYTQSKSELRKYNMNDTLFARYSELGNGNITGMDVTNPMRLTVFYADFSRVVILDNTLNYLRNTIDLMEEGMEQVLAVCSSYDGGLWMYNRDNFTLQRFNVQLKPDRSIPNLNTVISADFRPEMMLEKENILYLYDRGTGIHLFDIYAGYLKTLPLALNGTFAVLDNSIYWVDKNELHRYSMQRFTEDTWPLAPPSVSAFGLGRKKMALYAGGKVYVYTIEN